MSDTSFGGFLRSLFLDMLPFLTVVFFIMMIAVPFGFFTKVHIGGLWPMIAIGYWRLVRPRAMPLSIVFVSGLMTDIVTFVPFGIHGCVYILACLMLKKQRRFLLGQGFWVMWAAFALMLLGVHIGIYILGTVFLHGSISFVFGVWGAAVAWGCVPLVVWFLGRIHDMIDLFDEPL